MAEDEPALLARQEAEMETVAAAMHAPQLAIAPFKMSSVAQEMFTPPKLHMHHLLDTPRS